MKSSCEIFKKANRQKLIQIVLMIIVLCLFFFLIFNLHLSVLRKDFSVQAESQFGEISKLVAKEQEMMFKAEFDNLVEFASTEVVFPTEPSINTLKFKLGKMPDSMGIAMADGTDVISGESLSLENFFKQSIAGNQCIDHTKIKNAEGRNQVVLSIPLYLQNEVYAVLYSVISNESLNKHFTPSFYNGNGQVYLVQKNLDYLEENLRQIDILKCDDNYKETLKAIKYSIKNNALGSTAINCGSSGKYVIGFVPMENSQLYLFAAASYDDVGFSDSSVKKHVLLFFNVMLFGALTVGAVIVISKSKSKERLSKARGALESVISNIPGGVIRFRYDDCLTIQFFNEGALKLTRYSQDQIDKIFDNKFIGLVHQDDRQALLDAISDQMRNKNIIEINCRIKCSDGQYRWVLFKGNIFTTEADGDTCLCVLTDINETKLALQRLNTSMQRYAIVMEQSDSIIFEYNTSNRLIFMSDQWKKKFKPIDSNVDFIEYMIESRTVYKDDIEKFYSTFDPIETTNTTYKCELRLMASDGRYIWCRLKASCIVDAEDNSYRIIGKISDIDQQKIEQESLKKKAEMDSLSGLYNKGTVQMLIDRYLSGSGKDGIHALMILDIDNFKAVNDNLGHLAGDDIIADFTFKMKTILRSTDICGRIGGDEFVALMKDVKDEAIVRQRASELCEIFRSEIELENLCLRISGSIGIAFYNQHGLTYNELMQKADTALYEAKNLGKDQYAIYKGQ